MRIHALVTDAFGGQGGIAKFNRDLLTALCSHPDCKSVTAFPRLMPDASQVPSPLNGERARVRGGQTNDASNGSALALPEKLTYVTAGLGGKGRYVRSALKATLAGPKPDLLICGHINLLPIARTLQLIHRAPVTLIIHGIEAWQPPGSRFANRCARSLHSFVAVSEFTRGRFADWTGLPTDHGYILPNSIDLEKFGPGAPDPQLFDRYKLHGRKIILTVGRLSAAERYKGIDEVLEVLPGLAREIPNLTYLVVGDGTDRARLEKKAADLQLTDRVVFAGHIPEGEKVAHYRLADAFVMTGWGEGFGIVYLEAMACGVPVVASKRDASREVVRDGGLGIAVDPKNPAEIHAGILEALRRPKGVVPEGLKQFSYPNYRQKCHDIVNLILKR